MFHHGKPFVADLNPVRVGVLIQPGVDVQAALGAAPGDQVDDHLTGHERLSRPLREMKLNRRCSLLFHLLVPGGKCHTSVLPPLLSERFCSSTRQSQPRGLLDPPQSAVIVSVLGVRLTSLAEFLPASAARGD
jgi:hypothetical protein